METNSNLTVYKLLKLHSMKGAELIAGKSGLDRSVTMLNIMEVPDIIDWVSKGDFLLTTAYSFKDNKDDLTKLVGELADKEIAGFGIKMKRYVDEIPKEAISMAEDKGFPIIELPYDVSFSTILVEGFTEIVNSQASTLIRIDTIHRELIKIMLSGGKLKDIAEAFYKMFDRNAVGLRDFPFDNKIILCEPEYKEYVSMAFDRETFKRNTDKVVSNSQERIKKGVDMWDDKQVNLLKVPIYPGNIDYGHIYIWENKRELTPFEINLIESSTSFIALEIYKNLAVFESQSSQITEFFEGLLSGEAELYDEAIKRSHFFDFHPFLPHAVMVFYYKNPKPTDDLRLAFSSENQLIKQKNLVLIQRINSNKSEEVIAAEKNNHLIIIIGVQSDVFMEHSRGKVLEVYKNVKRFLSYSGIQQKYIATAGRFYGRSEDLWKSHREAMQAVRYAESRDTDSVIFFEDLGIFRILTFDAIQQEMEKVRDDELGVLLKYDKDQGTNLLETLKEYFNLQGNLTKVAQKLFVHYNTVVYRIERIKEIAGIDFDNYDQCLSLQVAFKIEELKKSGRDLVENS